MPEINVVWVLSSAWGILAWSVDWGRARSSDTPYAEEVEFPGTNQVTPKREQIVWRPIIGHRSGVFLVVAILLTPQATTFPDTLRTISGFGCMQ